MVDIAEALATKYAILGEQARAATTTADANAALAKARAQYEVPAQARMADAQGNYYNTEAQTLPGFRDAQGNYYNSMGDAERAQGKYYNAEAQTLPGFRDAMSNYYRDMGGAEQAQAGLTNTTSQQLQQTYHTGNEDVIRIINDLRGPFQAAQQRNSSALSSGSMPSASSTSDIPGASNTFNTPDASSTFNTPNTSGASQTPDSNGSVFQIHARGTSRVKGKGKPNKDTVPAMLAPGEAVLNQGAADHVGRNLIDVLNAIGAHKMAMAGNPVPGAGGAPPQGQMPIPSGRGMPQGPG
jgi:hypothetical protein